MRLSLYSFAAVLILRFVILRVTCDDRSNCILSKSGRRPSLKRKMGLDLGGPIRGANYNPNYGYEPYWPLGDWVFGSTPREKIDICGKHCSPIYLYFGYVCGRNLSYAHKTFDNYCDLLHEDCSGRAKWLIAYRGKCQSDLKTYPTEHVKMRTRAMGYIEDFYYRNPVTVSNTYS